MSILKQLFSGALSKTQGSVLAQFSPPYRLNIGCGRNIKEGWINIDSAPLSGVDLVCNLEEVRQIPIALPEGSVELFYLSHVLEHVRDSLGLMEELWRLASPGAVAVIRVPHGASDDAWEDPTHVRPYFGDSFLYFSQPAYWRADYGYRADWRPDKLEYRVRRHRCDGLGEKEILNKIQFDRNVVKELICEMSAIKPMRAAKAELLSRPVVEVSLVD